MTCHKADGQDVKTCQLPWKHVRVFLFLVNVTIENSWTSQISIGSRDVDTRGV